MSLSDQFYLCYLDLNNLLAWIKTNQLIKKDFSTQKVQWETKINKEPNFFSDTELLLVMDDILLLKVLDDQQATFLAQTYQLKRQSICQKIFGGTKNIILLNEKEWNFLKKEETTQTERTVVLLKDETTIKKSFANWLAKKKN